MKKLVLLLAIALFVYKAGYACELVASNSSSFKPKKEFLPGEDLVYLKLVLPDTDKDKIDEVKLKIISALGQDREEFILTEIGKNTGVFRTEKGIKILAQKRALQDGVIQVSTSQDIIYVLYPEGPGKERVVATLTTLAVIDKFEVLVDNFIQTAGKSFPVEIVAKDRQGNVLVDYAGTVNIEVEAVCLLTVSSFVAGKAKVFLDYPETGKLKITVRDLNQKQGESKEIVFLPANFKLEPFEPQPYTVGKEFSLKVTALNYRDAVTTNYQGRAVVKPLGQDTAFQGNILFSKGIAEANINYNQWGQRRFMLCDKEYPDVCGRTENLFFAPYRFSVEIDSPPKDRKKFYFEELFKGRVRVFDYQGKLIPEYGGVAILEPVKDVDMPSRLYFGWHDKGEDNFYLSGITPKPFKVKVYDAIFPEAKGESKEISLMPAKIKTELIELKGDKAKIKTGIEDDQGRVIKEDNSTVFTVHLVETNPNESAYLIAPKKFKAKNGQAIIAVANKEKEIVTVFVESEPYLEAIPLDITFE